MTFKARIKFFIIPDTPQLFNWLSDEAQISLTHLEELAHFGGLYINKKRITDLNYKDYTIGEVIRLHLDPKLFDTKLLSQIEVLESTPDWVLAFKPAGLPTHETLDNIQQNVKTELQKKLQTPLYPLFRLDVGTQGLLLMAKNKEYAKTFNQFQIEQLVTKGYWAFTKAPGLDDPDPLWIDYMKKSNRAPRELISHNAFVRLPTEEQAHYQECQLQILKFQIQDTLCQWDLNLLTGRTHQIRCQMKLRGLPLLGDQLYGGQASINLGHEVLGLICHHLSWPGHGHGSRNEFSLSRDRIPKLLSGFI